MLVWGWFIFKWFLPELLSSICVLFSFFRIGFCHAIFIGQLARAGRIRGSLAWLRLDSRFYHRSLPFTGTAQPPWASFWSPGCSKLCYWCGCLFFSSTWPGDKQTEASAHPKSPSCKYPPISSTSRNFPAHTQSNKPPSKPWPQTPYTAGSPWNISARCGTSAGGSSPPSSRSRYPSAGCWSWSTGTPAPACPGYDPESMEI